MHRINLIKEVEWLLHVQLWLQWLMMLLTWECL